MSVVALVAVTTCVQAALGAPLVKAQSGSANLDSINLKEY